MKILIDNENEKINIDQVMEKKIEDALSTAFSILELGNDYEISITVVDKNEIKDLNRDYRGVDKVTDVLSFPLYEPDEIPSAGMLGDIVICSERVKEQALEFNHSEEREFIYLSIHSLLHLLGYDHIEEDDRVEMRSLEKKIMKNLGIFKWNIMTTKKQRK